MMFPQITPYTMQADRPLCGICGPETQKRAVFFYRRRRRPLCARCMIDLLFELEAHDRRAQILAERRTLAIL